ncbi:hypothetical protein G6F56_007106 [Rhizopus delemar]|nr:hypothetical protein G6F56_007106 [Rhizopus delemar]
MSSVAFLHFLNHALASVFFNTYVTTGLNMDALACAVRPTTDEDNNATTYSQVGITRFLPVSRSPPDPPPSATVSPPPGSP